MNHALSVVPFDFGGATTKATLETCAPMDSAKRACLEFQFNPEEIEVERHAAGARANALGAEHRLFDQAGGVERESMVRFEVVFDTYEDKPATSVYKTYVAALEDMLANDEQTGTPPALLFTWGGFTEGVSRGGRLNCKLASMRVRYTMFLNEGTPVRARVQLALRVGPGMGPDDGSKASASQGSGAGVNGAKLVTVARGDTLSAIASREYGKPHLWRHIADANDLDDPLDLPPGTRLLVPPVL